MDDMRGWLRQDGRKGIRNHDAYLVECAHHVAREIASPLRDDGVHLIGFPGCYPNDYALHMMERLCTHQNVGAVLLVSLGCESLDRHRLHRTIAASGRPVKLHSLWSVPAASRICAALEPLEPLGPLWVEDPVRRMDGVSAVSAVARATRIPLAGGETLASRPIFRDLLNRDALGTVIIDLGWCGGLSEARRIAVLADSWARPVAPHDCSGPVFFAASVHLAMHAPNAAFQECVRAFLRGWYRDTVTEIPHVAGGVVHALPGPGLGTRLLPGFADRPGATVRRTTRDSLG